MGMPEKVVKFENENMKIYNVIQGWVKDLNRNNRDYEEYYEGNSSKTVIAYETDVRMFMRLIRNKEKGSELEYLTLDEIQFTLEDLEEFKEKVLDLRNEDGKYTYTNKSLNRKLSGIKNFIRYMAKKKLIKDISFLGLVSSEKVKEKHYGVLSINEIMDMVDWIMEHERELKLVKKYLVLFSLDTCIRKSAVLRLTWSDFLEEDDVVLVKGIDKGNNEFRKKISKEFYNELLTIKDESDDNRVFKIQPLAIQKLMDRYREFFKINPERNITWHSIRKSGVSFQFRLTKDILQAQKAAGHKNITTTQIYLDDEDYGAIGAVSSMGKLDEDLYKKVEHETLIKAIGMMKKDTQLLINLKLQEILKEN
jgi:integrase